MCESNFETNLNFEDNLAIITMNSLMSWSGVG